MKKQLELQQVLESIPEPIQAVKDQQDLSYQKFLYCFANRNRHVYYPWHESIDYPKAESEITSLDWTYQQNGISILNARTDENIFCSRLQDDKWFVLTAVLENNVYDGYQWASYPNTTYLFNVIRAFFDETFWFDTLEWSKILWESNLKE